MRSVRNSNSSVKNSFIEVVGSGSGSMVQQHYLLDILIFYQWYMGQKCEM